MRGTAPKEIAMYEVVKVVNGHEITRMKGTQKCYWVLIKRFANSKIERSFKTIKAAAAFCETF